MRELTVPAKYNGKTLEKFLTGTFGAMPFAAIRRAFRDRDVKVNGQRQDRTYPVSTGDRVQVYIDDCTLMGIGKPRQIYSDEKIVIVEKPAGICVCDPPENELSLCDILPGNLMPCHRLDRNTEGLVILAKTPAAREEIESLIRDRRITKKYRTLVVGRPPRESAVLRLWMTKDSRSGLVRVYDTPAPGRVEAITEYSVVRRAGDDPAIYELDINLHTGRTHQIRACLAHIGCPVLGDTKYGNFEANRRLGRDRQALSAYSLTIPGYDEGRELVVTLDV